MRSTVTRFGAAALVSPRLVWVVPLGIASVIFFWICIQANRDIRAGMDAQIEMQNGAFCEQLVGPQGTPKYATCISLLSELIKKDNEVEASSGLF